jgi:hypothetical protein
MFGHLPEETLMDLVDGTAAPHAREHVQACLACRTRVSEVAAAWALAEASDVPEPSPLYWEAFRRQVDRRIQSEGQRRWPRFLVPLAVAVGLVVATAVPRMTSPKPVASPPLATVLPAWSPLPAAEDDPGLAVLKAVASGDPELASSYERSGIQELLSDLSDEESQALAERLATDGVKAGAL